MIEEAPSNLSVASFLKFTWPLIYRPGTCNVCHQDKQVVLSRVCSGCGYAERQGLLF